MRAAALHWLHGRLVGGTLDKAQQGTLRWRLPVGVIYDAAGQMAFDPAEAIQHAVRQVFAVCATAQSALAVVKHVADHGWERPARRWQRARKDEVVWRPRRHARVLSLVHNPCYAGVYVSGRPKTRQQSLPGEAPRVQGSTRQGTRADWPTILHAHHPASRSWAPLRHHLEPREETRPVDADQHRGAVRAGGALWPGIGGVASAAVA